MQSKASCRELSEINTHSHWSREKRRIRSTLGGTRLCSQGIRTLPQMDKEAFTLKEGAQRHSIIKPVQRSAIVQGNLSSRKNEIAIATATSEGWGHIAYSSALPVRAGKNLGEHPGGKKQAKLCRFGVRNRSQACPHSAAKSRGSLHANLNLTCTQSS